MVNPVAAGFVAGGILARNAGPRAVVGGGIAFAAFSGAIDLFLRRETAEYVLIFLHEVHSSNFFAARINREVATLSFRRYFIVYQGTVSSYNPSRNAIICSTPATYETWNLGHFRYY